MGISDMIRDAATRGGIDPGDNPHKLNTARSITEHQNYNTPTPHQAHYADILTRTLPGNSVLHGQISRLLVTDEIHRRTHHETSGRLDRRAITRMRTGALDVYSRRDDTPGIDTALMILIDGSASMREYVGSTTRMGMAQSAAWHIARAAESAGAKVAISVFHTNAKPNLEATVTVIKDWDTPVSQCAAALLHTQPHYWTPLAPSIMHVAPMIADMSANRKLLMVLTDGECDWGADAVRSACRYAAGLGVETVGIGMACESIVAAFPKPYSVNVNDLAHLARTGLGVLVDILEEADPRGAD
jgi:hypothetical protein